MSESLDESELTFREMVKQSTEGVEWEELYEKDGL